MSRLIALAALALVLAGCNLVRSQTVYPTPSLPTPVFIRVDYAATQTRAAPVDDVAVPTERPPQVDSGGLPQAIVDNLRMIYARGQQQGRRAGAFSKVGDSITVSQHFLVPIGQGRYQLREFGYLQPVIDHFSAARTPGGNVFSHRSLAAGTGWAAWGVFNPEFADPTQCFVNETPLACEYRVIQPSIALIMFGTNDVGYRSPGDYRADLDRIVRTSLEAGIIPIFSTIPNRPDVSAQVTRFNGIIAEIAQNYQLPLWDYHTALEGLPNHGLTWDNVHPSSPDADPAYSADFRVDNLRYGTVIRNLTALHVLDLLWRVLA